MHDGGAAVADTDDEMGVAGLVVLYFLSPHHFVQGGQAPAAVFLGPGQAGETVIGFFLVPGPGFQESFFALHAHMQVVGAPGGVGIQPVSDLTAKGSQFRGIFKIHGDFSLGDL